MFIERPHLESQYAHIDIFAASGQRRRVPCFGTPAATSWILDRGADINRRDNEFESTPTKSKE
jgi:hypothetical protein